MICGGKNKSVLEYLCFYGKLIIQTTTLYNIVTIWFSSELIINCREYIVLCELTMFRYPICDFDGGLEGSSINYLEMKKHDQMSACSDNVPITVDGVPVRKLFISNLPPTVSNFFNFYKFIS